MEVFQCKATSTGGTKGATRRRQKPASANDQKEKFNDGQAKVETVQVTGRFPSDGEPVGNTGSGLRLHQRKAGAASGEGQNRHQKD